MLLLCVGVVLVGGQGCVSRGSDDEHTSSVLAPIVVDDGTRELAYLSFFRAK